MLTECADSSSNGVDNNRVGNHTEINSGGGNYSAHTSNNNHNNMGQSTSTTTARGCAGEGYFSDLQWSSDLATFTALPLTSLATIGECLVIVIVIVIVISGC